jgi:hypothetical protein
MSDQPKDKSKNRKTGVKDSQVGVMGDHAKIDGGIHFHYHSSTPTRYSDKPEPKPQQPSISEQPLSETIQPGDNEKWPKVFISYAREDQDQAIRLYGDLKKACAIPWLDVEDLLPGQKWRTTIRQAIKKSDYVIVILSTHSISKRGFVQAELKKALEILEEFPANEIFMIPARLDGCTVTDEKLLELNIVDLFPDWENGLAKILRVICPNDLQDPEQPRLPPEPRPRMTPDDFLQPGGAMDVESRFYIERQADADVLEGVSRHRGLVTLQGPRQTGKTSMMLRLYTNTRQPESSLRPVIIDFQGLSGRRFESLTAVWQAVLTKVDSQLDIGALIDDTWNPKANYDRNVTGYLEHYVFANNDTPVLVCLDEVDKVFSTLIRSDFFPSVRAFFNRGAYDPVWKRVRWLLSTSSEPRFFIDDLNQSPFNVGIRVTLPAFTLEETADFAGRYGISQDRETAHRIIKYVGGKPYLVHLLLHHMALEPARESVLFDAHSAGDGLFKSHLDRYLAKLQDQPDLVSAMKRVIAGKGCDDVKMADRLASAGLVKADTSGNWICACDLYAEYLGGRL